MLNRLYKPNYVKNSLTTQSEKYIFHLYLPGNAKMIVLGAINQFVAAIYLYIVHIETWHQLIFIKMSYQTNITSHGWYFINSIGR